METSCCVCKSPSLVPVLNHVNLVDTFLPYFSYNHSNVILLYIYIFQVISSLQVF